MCFEFTLKPNGIGDMQNSTYKARIEFYITRSKTSSNAVFVDPEQVVFLQYVCSALNSTGVPVYPSRRDIAWEICPLRGQIS